MSNKSNSSSLKGVGAWTSCPSISGASINLSPRNDSPSMAALTANAPKGVSPMLAGYLGASPSSQPWSSAKPK